MARTQPLALSGAVLASASVLLGACAHVPPPASRAAPAPSPPPALPADSDWRQLPPAPFGASLQQLQQPLHEVLLFADRDAPAGAAAPERECYAPDGGSRRFLGRELSSYQLCLRNGRLHSVEASVQLPAAEAAALFARYCDDWLRLVARQAERTAGACSGAAAAPGPAFEASLGERGEEGTVTLLIVVHQDIPKDPP